MTKTKTVGVAESVHALLREWRDESGSPIMRTIGFAVRAYVDAQRKIREAGEKAVRN